MSCESKKEPMPKPKVDDYEADMPKTQTLPVQSVRIEEGEDTDEA